MRKFPGYDDDMITLWFDRMNQIAPRLVSPFEVSFRGLTFPDLIPVANLYDALIRYASLDHIKQYRADAVKTLPELILMKLVMVTIGGHGEMYFADRGKIKPYYIIFNDLIDAIDEEDYRYQPYVAAFNQFVRVAAYIGSFHPRGQIILKTLAASEPVRHEKDRCETPASSAHPSSEARKPRLSLVVSNGKWLK